MHSKTHVLKILKVLCYLQFLKNTKHGRIVLNTPCPSAPVRCAPLASLVDNFAEITSSIPNYASPANKWKNHLPQSNGDFISGDFWETAAPH